MNEIRKLVDELNRYRSAYYNQNKSLISDREYDALYDKLEQMEKTTGIIYVDSPTQNVGCEAVSKLKKVKHDHPLLSLAKTTDINGFADYFDGKEVCLMGKMDGLTASLHYSGGKLISAESRGNGEIGEDITHNARVFANLPMNIPFDGDLTVDGECIIDKETFLNINENEQADFKNPRNLVSGSVRQLDSEVAKRRRIRFIAWKLYGVNNPYGAELDTVADKYDTGFEFLKSLGFEVVPYTVLRGTGRKISQADIDEIRAKCDELKYPIDGLVAAFNDVAYGDSLGGTGHHPKHSLAFKFYQDGVETVLTDIEWTTSRTGIVNPVAIFEPVDIDGTTVSRATLNNVSIIKELELEIGDAITVYKANEIIPQIRDNLTRTGTYILPRYCPSCGTRLIKKSDTGREFLCCPNKDCPGILRDKLDNFASREGMNIVGLSDERIKTLITKGLLTKYSDIYRLYKYEEEISECTGFGKTSASILLDAIAESQHCKFSNLLYALGIPGVGKSAAKSISNYCVANRGREDILRYFIRVGWSKHDWTSISGIGKATSDAINRYIRENYDDIADLADLIIIKENKEFIRASHILEGKSFCVTGKLSKFENRESLLEEVELHGGRPMLSVTAKTDYLITNTPESGTGKNKLARKYGTKIITEENFIRMCGDI